MTRKSRTVQEKPAKGGPRTDGKSASTRDVSAEPKQTDEPSTTPAATASPSKSRRAAQATKTSPLKRKAGQQQESEPTKSLSPSAADISDQPDATAPKKKRKTKEQKQQESMPLAARTASIALKIGAHVSAAGGVHNAVANAVHIGANAFALFLKSQRKWENPPLKEDVLLAFKDACKEHSYDAHKHCVPHGSYLVNLAAEEKAKADQAYSSFLDDLTRCERLGIRLYNFHPGNTNGRPRPDAIARLAGQLNRAHKATTSVVTLVENMAAAKSANTLGGSFEDLRDIIALVDDKSRVGVCLDTCHAFAAGYDMRDNDTLQTMLAEFDKVVGVKYLKAVHLNDSKGMFNSNRDLHQNVGLGFLGLRAFHAIVNEPRFHGIPLILETPCDTKDSTGKVVEDKSIWSREIKLLESLVGMDVDGDEFKAIEEDLQAKGAAERLKLQAQFEKKNSPKKTAPGAKKK